MYTSIFLTGFRTTGKSTIGKFLAKKLRLEFVDMDEEIERRAGKSIAELTNGGKDWQAFRKMEHDLVLQLSGRKNVIVSMGGGALVNAVCGEENARILQRDSGVLLVLLKCNEDVIRQRIIEQEMHKKEVKRPVLDEARAAQLEETLKKHEDDPEKQKKILVGEIVADSLRAYKERVPLYAALTETVFDTGEMKVEQVVKAIINKLKNDDIGEE